MDGAGTRVIKGFAGSLDAAGAKPDSQRAPNRLTNRDASGMRAELTLRNLASAVGQDMAAIGDLSPEVSVLNRSRHAMGREQSSPVSEAEWVLVDNDSEPEVDISPNAGQGSRVVGRGQVSTSQFLRNEPRDHNGLTAGPTSLVSYYGLVDAKPTVVVGRQSLWNESQETPPESHGSRPTGLADKMTSQPTPNQQVCAEGPRDESAWSKDSSRRFQLSGTEGEAEAIDRLTAGSDGGDRGLGKVPPTQLQASGTAVKNQGIESSRTDGSLQPEATEGNRSRAGLAAEPEHVASSGMDTQSPRRAQAGGYGDGPEPAVPRQASGLTGPPRKKLNQESLLGVGQTSHHTKFSTMDDDSVVSAGVSSPAVQEESYGHNQSGQKPNTWMSGLSLSTDSGTKTDSAVRHQPDRAAYRPPAQAISPDEDASSTIVGEFSSRHQRSTSDLTDGVFVSHSPASHASEAVVSVIGRVRAASEASSPTFAQHYHSSPATSGRASLPPLHVNSPSYASPVFSQGTHYVPGSGASSTIGDASP
eukprot:scaffold647946_cov36-Prasinocladus_malaysianus.AAC.1